MNSVARTLSCRVKQLPNALVERSIGSLVQGFLQRNMFTLEQAAGVVVSTVSSPCKMRPTPRVKSGSRCEIHV